MIQKSKRRITFVTNKKLVTAQKARAPDRAATFLNTIPDLALPHVPSYGPFMALMSSSARCFFPFVSFDSDSYPSPVPDVAVQERDAVAEVEEAQQLRVGRRARHQPVIPISTSR